MGDGDATQPDCRRAHQPLLYQTHWRMMYSMTVRLLALLLLSLAAFAQKPKLPGEDWLTLFVHFLSLSLLAVGGAITTTPDMHRFLVEGHHWLTNEQFVASVALALAVNSTSSSVYSLPRVRFTTSGRTPHRSAMMSAAVSGVGVHSGSPATLTLLPADANSGIVFVRCGQDGRPDREIRADVRAVTATEFANRVRASLAARAVNPPDNAN